MTVQINYIIYHLQYNCLIIFEYSTNTSDNMFNHSSNRNSLNMEKVNSYCKTHEGCQTVDSGQTNKQIAVLIAPSLIHQGSGYITYHRRLSPWYKARSARYRYHPPSTDQHPSSTDIKIIEMKNVFFFFFFFFFCFFFFFNMSRER